MAAKGKITRTTNCNEGGVKGKYQKRLVKRERERIHRKVEKNCERKKKK